MGKQKTSGERNAGEHTRWNPRELVQGHREYPEKCMECAGEKSQGELCWAHVEMLVYFTGDSL